MKGLYEIKTIPQASLFRWWWRFPLLKTGSGHVKRQLSTFAFWRSYPEYEKDFSTMCHLAYRQLGVRHCKGTHLSPLNFPDVVRREHRLLSWNRPCDVAHTSNDTKHLQESCKGVLAFQTFPDRLGLQDWLAEKIYAWTVHAFFFQLWFYWDPGFVKRVCIKNYLALYKCSKAMWFTSMSL